MALTDARPRPTRVRVACVPSPCEPEQADDTVLLSEHRPADEDDVVEPFELDRAVDRQVGTRSARQLSVERNVDQHRSVLDGRIDAR